MSLNLVAAKLLLHLIPHTLGWTVLVCRVGYSVEKGVLLSAYSRVVVPFWWSFWLKEQGISNQALGDADLEI